MTNVQIGSPFGNLTDHHPDTRVFLLAEDALARKGVDMGELTGSTIGIATTAKHIQEAAEMVNTQAVGEMAPAVLNSVVRALKAAGPRLLHLPAEAKADFDADCCLLCVYEWCKLGNQILIKTAAPSPPSDSLL